MAINILNVGIAGCGEREYFKKFGEYCKKREKKLNYISITDIVLKLVQETHPEVNRYNLLNFPKTARDAWYKNVFEFVLKKGLKKDAINVINTHVTYWWKYGPEEVVDGNIFNWFLKELDPIFCTQIVDTAKNIKKRVDKVAEDIGRTLSLEDIYMWQDMEHFVMKIFASINQNPLYLIPKRQPIDTLYRLIFTKDLKVYLSFPMSEADEKVRVATKGFFKKLNRLAIVFSPEKIEEYPHYSSRLKRISADTTVKRDYRLISQSDLVVAFFPKVVYSSGVISEINFARSIGKTVYLIWPKKRYSPFTAYLANRTFFSQKECLDEIKRLKREL